MKTIFSLIFTITSFIMFSQTLPPPPAPPTANAGVTNSGITYSFAKTQNSLALSCTFNDNNYENILEAIRSEYAEFNAPVLSFNPAGVQTFKYKIELKQHELKLSYEYSPGDSNADVTKLNKIASKILQL